MLLLLGARERTPNPPAVPVATNQNQVPELVRRILLFAVFFAFDISEAFYQDPMDTPQRLNVPQRLASLIRFREKRKERNFDKKIRYAVRKEVALRYDTIFDNFFMVTSSNLTFGS